MLITQRLIDINKQINFIYKIFKIFKKIFYRNEASHKLGWIFKVLIQKYFIQKKLRFLLLVFKLKYYNNKKITISTISKLY